MNNLVVQLRVNSKLDSTNDNDSRDLRIVRSLLDKIHLNVVDLIKYEYESSHDLNDGEHNSRPALYNDETIVYVRLAVEPENKTFFQDDGHNLLKYIGDALDFRPSRVVTYTERLDNGFTETTIQITIGEVIDGIAHNK